MGDAGLRCCRVAFVGAQRERNSLYILFLLGRVINAGKSQHNEDQACCEVVFVERRPSPRGRLPSREGSGELNGVRTGDTTGRMPCGIHEMGHVVMFAHHCFLSNSLGSWASCGHCPCWTTPGLAG